ncbi:MAG TPA: type II toxin-antitoxin system VapC family toxin [Verrucomicrobiae bacterium]|nr:type II toxin-antitoxin system VapC family toxin [Verrucomicrobiae bacterium]
MNLLDSNIVIAAASGSDAVLDALVVESPFAVSVVTRIEVLGFHRLTPEDNVDLQTFLVGGQEFPLDEAVVASAIRLRQERRISLGDAIIAATALVHNLTLLTRNVDDFKHVSGLKFKNPFA